MKKHILYISVLVLLFTGCKNNSDSLQLTSPDSKYTVNLTVHDGLAYSVNWNDKNIIEESVLGFKLSDGTLLPDSVEIIQTEYVSNHTTWQPVYGERKEYPEHYNEMLVHLKSAGFQGEFAVRLRAYNEGVAFRYEIKSRQDIRIDEELTEFAYPVDANVWATGYAQGEIQQHKLSELSFIAERPLLAELSDSVYTAIGEAALVNFARMRFKNDTSKTTTLTASLSKNTFKENNFQIIIPAGGYTTPWRYVMAGKTPAQLLQNNYLLLNLNEANKIANTSFIKPGKVIREVTLTTQGGMACVDFAAKHNLQFVHFDSGWYGHEYDDDSDATTITVDPKRSPGPLDLHKVIEYANEKGIGIILYVNSKALENQLDEILPLYKSWGIAGVKYGFVNAGPQKWTTWLHEAIRKAAENDLMVNIHDEYRPTGYSRTYPNLMTSEGIRGDGQSTTNDLVINTIFTRMIAGSGDQTNCYFASRVHEIMGSHASQMAKVICIYSPWQYLFGYDRPQGSPSKTGGAGGAEETIPEIDDLQFFAEVPTVWDDTRVIEGYPGKYVSVVRKSGDKWYLGAIAGTEAYNLSIPLDFLEKNKTYKAKIFSDDASLNMRTNVRIREIEVTHDTVLKQDILKQNGLAVIFTPVENNL